MVGKALAALALFGLAVAPPRPAAAAAPPAVTAKQIDQAIERGKAFLFRTQLNGNWELVPKPDPEAGGGFDVRGLQWGGPTAIATLSLLAAGVDPNDPRIKRAVEFLAAADLRGTYAVGLRAQIWNLLPPTPGTKAAGLADLNLLLNGLHTDRGPGNGMYGYPLVFPHTGYHPEAAFDWDHSVSQFAVLGAWSLAQQGLEVPTAYWRDVDAAWHRQEQPDGSWSYGLNPDGTVHQTTAVSMTAAAAATLFITQEYTQMAPRCGGNPDDPGLDAAMRFLGQHLDDVVDYRRYYVLFGVSRVGLASGYKYLGDTDWFRWGAEQIVAHQDADGAWRNANGGEAINGVPDTAFALLFLSRGRLPLMMNKLDYDVTVGTGKAAKAVPAPWDQRPRDVANLSRWVGRQLESPLNWQVVNLRGPAGDLHDAPILYMAGNKAPKLSADDVAKLRAYCEDGGLLLGHADCGSAEFAKGFKALGEQMFPGRRFRPLEPDHPIFTGESFPASRWHQKVVLEGMTNGARELMLLLPNTDPARLWQSQSFQSVKTDVMGQLMIDVLLYSVDKEGLRRRGDTYVVDRAGNAPAAGRPVRVARVKYAGNWDPEPGGWRRLANVLHNAGTCELAVQAVDPAAGDNLDPAQFPLASLTVADRDAKLTDPVRAAIRAYVDGGGTLLVDVAGGDGPQRTAAETELSKLFKGPSPPPLLDAASPVYTAGGPKLAVGSVDYRRYHRLGAIHDPRLRGYAVGGRTAVVYTPEDVSAGLVGQPMDGITGYAPADATRVVSAVIAYAAKLHP